MIQLVFDAARRARGARATTPTRSATASTRAPSAPPGTTTSSSSSAGRIRSCYPAAGSHANFFDEALYLGSSAERGRRLRRHARADVRRAARSCRRSRATRPQARAAFPWIAFEGRWGELQRGVLQRPDRAEPEDAVDGADHAGPRAGATRSYAVPGRRRARHRRDRLLLRRGRGGLERAAAGALDQPLPFAGRARSRSLVLLVLCCSRARRGGRRAAPPRAPARVGPDPRRRRARCT